MPLVRLVGLALFITAIFLGLAAAITKTTHIRVRTRGTSNIAQPSIAQPSIANGQLVLPPPTDPGVGGEFSATNPDAAQFTSVPIMWPLIIAAGLGLLMWFMLASDPPRASSYTNERSGRRR